MAVPGHAGSPADRGVLRRRLDDGPVAPLKLASGCDRRCSFCAIPSFRGAFVSRPPDEVLAEARWLAEQGVRELVLVSENSTSYGKDLGDLRRSSGCCPSWPRSTASSGSGSRYLQPAETRPSLIEAIATTPGVAPYFDLSFQHASRTVLRRMRRFGGTESFLELLDRVRALAPEAGRPLQRHRRLPRRDRGRPRRARAVPGRAPGSTPSACSATPTRTAPRRPTLDGKLDPDVIADRVERVSALVEELTAQRAEDRVGEHVVGAGRGGR